MARWQFLKGAEEYPIIEIFADDDHRENFFCSIYPHGFHKPCTGQQRVIRTVHDDRHTVGQAQSGTGETSTLVLGCLQCIGCGFRAACQAFVLAPMRGLASQIQTVSQALEDYGRVKGNVCIGGTSARDDIDRLCEGQHWGVGMPGRVFHTFNMRHFREDDLIVFVLDDADEMVPRGFRGHIFDLVKSRPPNVQVSVFCAVLVSELRDSTMKFMCGDMRILAEKDDMTLEGICQFRVAMARAEWTLDTLCELYEMLVLTQAIIYRNTWRLVGYLADQLTERDFMFSMMLAELDQQHLLTSDRDHCTKRTRATVRTLSGKLRHTAPGTYCSTTQRTLTGGAGAHVEDWIAGEKDARAHVRVNVRLHRPGVAARANASALRRWTDASGGLLRVGVGCEGDGLRIRGFACGDCANVQRSAAVQ